LIFSSQKSVQAGVPALLVEVLRMLDELDEVDELEVERLVLLDSPLVAAELEGLDELELPEVELETLVLLDSLLVVEVVGELDEVETDEAELEAPVLLDWPLEMEELSASRVLVVLERLTVGEKLPVLEGLFVSAEVSALDEPPVGLGDRDPDSVDPEQAGGGLGDGQVVRVLLTTTVTILGGLVTVKASEPWWFASTLAAMPETRAEMARSDWSERRCILTVDTDEDDLNE
jgi:hypothetical protein